ncbi:MAG: AAA family ATPase [Myxococcota bacterium]
MGDGEPSESDAAVMTEPHNADPGLAYIHELKIDQAEREAIQAEANDPREPPQPKPDPLVEQARTLRDWGFDLDKPPPPRRWLLRAPDPETDGETTKGWLPLGKVGIVAADGGTGKTFALVQLAIACAIGADWFGMQVAKPGRVFIGLAEEDIEECQRRIYYAARSMSLTPTDVRRALDRVVIAPAEGIDVALLELDQGGNASRTPRHTVLLDILQRTDEPWSLLVFDPLQSWAGVSTDRDNEIAERVIRAFAAFTAAPGGPTVLIAHHTSQAGNQGGKADAASIRGATGLVNSARWAATLAARRIAGMDTVELRVVKSNYSSKGRAISLVRDADTGALRKWTPMERKRREAETSQAARADLEDRIIQAIKEGDYTSIDAIRGVVRGTRQEVNAAIGRLKKSGRIAHSKKGEPYSVTA